MGAPKKTGRSHRLERWQIVLAALVAAVATIIGAVLARPSSGKPAGPQRGGRVSVTITGLSEHPYPPPPGRLYRWSGTARNLMAGASIFVIAKEPAGQAAAATKGEGSQPWLVSPRAVILI